MRRELPIALILIAAGIALWAGKNGELNRVLRLFKGESQAGINRPDSPSQTLPQFLPASSLNSVTDGQDAEFSPGAVSLEPSSLLAGIAVTTLEANQLLDQMSADLRDCPAFKLDLAAELNWQESSMLISGQYAQRGQGTGQSRIDLQLGTGAQARTLSKICDGRFLYSLQRSQGEKKLQFIDLKRIQETRLSAGLAEPDHPSNWIATGGLGGFYENVSAAFQFSPPQTHQAKGRSQLHMDGIWNPSALRKLLATSVPQHHLEPDIIWQKLPQHVPHQIRITLEQHAVWGWLPSQISFFRFAESAQTTKPGEIPSAGLRLLARITFSSPQQIEVDEAGFLQLNTEDVETIDNTPLYISQVKKFELQRQAQAPASPSTMLR